MRAEHSLLMGSLSGLWSPRTILGPLVELESYGIKIFTYAWRWQLGHLDNNDHGNRALNCLLYQKLDGTWPLTCVYIYITKAWWDLILDLAGHRDLTMLLDGRRGLYHTSIVRKSWCAVTLIIIIINNHLPVESDLRLLLPSLQAHVIYRTCVQEFGRVIFPYTNPVLRCAWSSRMAHRSFRARVQEFYPRSWGRRDGRSSSVFSL